MFPTAIRILHLNRALRYSASNEPGNETDSIKVFEPENFTDEDGLNGPRLHEPLPDPLFRGRLSLAERPFADDYTLEAGDYLFSQWRPEEYPSLTDALEELVRQAWWEGHKLTGPWIIRTVKEDGKTAFQGLRRDKSPR